MNIKARVFPVVFWSQQRAQDSASQQVWFLNAVFACAAVCMIMILGAVALRNIESRPNLLSALSSFASDQSAIAALVDGLRCDITEISMGNSLICISSTLEDDIVYIEMIISAGVVTRAIITPHRSTLLAGDLVLLLEEIPARGVSEARLRLGEYQVVARLEYWTGASYYHRPVRQLVFIRTNIA
ncbi:MAG: hypothetical protein IAE89_08740 [Anaerolineae bacterium]|nr:hypothetical protein [Anaerolineae bacterium]